MRPARRIIGPGSSGEDVRALQRKLNLRPDGLFGPVTGKAVKTWKRKHGRRHPGPAVTKAMWRDLGYRTGEWWPPNRTAGLTPGQIVSRIVLESQRLGFPHMTLEHVRESNAAHGPTVGGNRSDHQGPPSQAWAADISNSSRPTHEMDRMAQLIAHWLHVDWDGSGLVNSYLPGLRIQLIYRCDIPGAGNHFDHVHIGIRRA